LISIDGAIDGFSYREEEEKKREEGGSVHKRACIRCSCTKAKEKKNAEEGSTGARYMRHSLSHLNFS
jgi:hypothetical protein